ncbi:MAG: FAD-dependent oxidoreductase [Sedimenticolaceae bacterium]
MTRRMDEWLTGLPERLAERSRAIAASDAPMRGEYILYWMHHAVRGHENPALDVAISQGNRLGLPVLVYQGLSGRHLYNSDRHHTFIIEGARDAHRELSMLGVRAVFHLDESGQERSRLRELAARAALLVVEDFPAPPFKRWTMNLADAVSCPVVAVDCACIVPMRAQPKRFERAFEFRRHNQAEFDARVRLPWSPVRPCQPVIHRDIGFDALDLQRVDIAEVCAACAIDHSVPPVARTTGGAAAGYRRWQAFLSHGLSGYARDRNDAAVAWPRGVSRLSAYLHHGHVSPFRIARDAAASGGEGGAKFLDELLVWRELAFNLCFFADDPQSLSVLPAWAQSTLQEHACDQRASIIDDEALARSCSKDEVWDLAQTSLRIHGELHNNLRMTWAKAIPGWRPDPQAALDTLLELNHRYALDGSDPNSYGGLLWCLGLFDRPFSEAPVMGRVRTRSTRAHARRLDLDRYSAGVRRPASGKAMRIAVIGGGVSGLSSARVLHDQGHQVRVFEKSRGLGGRAATRRVDGVGFDHGAQSFTARDPVFLRAIEAWCEHGVVAPWQPRIGTVQRGRIMDSPDRQQRYVAVPGMSALGTHLGAGLDIMRPVRVLPPSRQGACWALRSEDGADLGLFDILVVSVPAPQARELLASAAPQLAQTADEVSFTPAWSVMLESEGRAELEYDGLFFDDGILAWAARNDSKPGREGDTWVLHASPDWSGSNLEASPDAVGIELTTWFCAATGVKPGLLKVASVHRWLYSLVPSPMSVGALWDGELQLGVCGDWCKGARIEDAFLSGHAVAGRILGDLAKQAKTN